MIWANVRTINISASTLKSVQNLNIKSNTLNLSSKENREYFDNEHKVKGGFLSSSLEQKDTISTTTQIKSLLKAKNINLSSKQIDMIASDIEALSTTIDTKLLNLISKKDSNYQDHFKKSGSLMTTTITIKDI